MLHAIPVILATTAIGALILLKSDQQFVHLLEGKLHRLGKNQNVAHQLYHGNTKVPARLLSSIGMGLIASAIVTWVEGCPQISIALSIPGILLVIGAIWDRARAFISANRKIDAL